MKTRLILFSCAALFALTVPGKVSAADTKIEQTLRDLDAKWSAAAGAKDVDKTVSYYAADAIVMPPNASAARSKEAIRNLWKEMLASPGLAISWKASNVEIAKSGEMAYLHGTYEFTANDVSGKPIKDRGKYLIVWKKQPGGTWKVAADIWNSDLPVPTSSPAPGAGSGHFCFIAPADT